MGVILKKFPFISVLALVAPVASNEKGAADSAFGYSVKLLPVSCDGEIAL